MHKKIYRCNKIFSEKDEEKNSYKDFCAAIKSLEKLISFKLNLLGCNRVSDVIFKEFN